MNISRRSFLKGTAAFIAVAAIPIGTPLQKPITPYIVFENSPLAEFGNRIPNFSFVVGQVLGDKLYSPPKPIVQGPRLHGINTKTIS